MSSSPLIRSQTIVEAECEGIKLVQTGAKLNKSIAANTNDKTSFFCMFSVKKKENVFNKK